MANRFLGHACSYLTSAQETLATHAAQLLKDYGVAPIKFAQLLQRWKALKSSNHHTHIHHYLTDIDTPNDPSASVLQFPGVNGKASDIGTAGCVASSGRKQKNFTATGNHIPTINQNFVSSSESHPFHKQEALGRHFGAHHPFPHGGKALLRTGRWPLVPGSFSTLSTAAAAAVAQASYYAYWRSHSGWRGWTREYSKKARPEFDTLFTKLPGASISDKFVGKLQKVTVVGVGNVGIAVAQTILTEQLTDFIALVDTDPKKLRGEMLDLQHAAAFMPTVEIVADVDYRITENSDICIITAGARQQEGEDRLSLVGRNVEVFKQIVPQLVKYSPNTIFLVVSNPVDILTWVTWKISGFPPSRVLGTGTNLDSSRFRFLLANHFKVSAQNVHAHIVGEHGDTSVPVWSSVRVAGVPVTAFLLNKGESDDKTVLKEAHDAVVNGAYEVIRLKGYTSWAIGYSAAWLVSSILRNQRKVHPVSVLSKGFHGIEEEVYISLPAMLGRQGVHAIVNSEFDKEEIRQLHESAAQIWDIQKKLKL